jgi:uncharacterized protein (DUF433 family)
MPSTTTGYEHIAVGEDDIVVIADAGMKVAQLVAEMMAYGWSPEELHFQHPYLSMGQIHSALAYYWDHQQEINRQIEADLRYADQMRQRLGDSPLVTRLKTTGLR